MRLSDPWVLAFLFLIPLFLVLLRRAGDKREPALRYSDVGFFKGIPSSARIFFRKKMVYLRSLALVLFIIAAARPQSYLEETEVHIEGVDIVLAIDISSSMKAMDFRIDGERVDRLAAVKDVVRDFIRKRPNDRIGIVAFAGLAYTACPLTLDHEWAALNLQSLEIGRIPEDGTAIGNALAASLNRLKETETKEKLIVLLTDGRNNSGNISPLTAAEAAEALDVKVYTIGAGSKGLAPYPVQDMFGNTVLRSVQIDIDEELLRKIADITGAGYYRATDTASLEEIYERIDQLEKTPIEEEGYNVYEELFTYFLIPGVILLLLEVILSHTVLRRIP